MVCGKVTENRLNSDQKAELALLTMIFKFLGNSAYAKVIKALERQTTKKYTKSESVLRKKLRSVSFNDLVEIGDEYKIETWKHKVDIYWPFQVGIAVYLFAKLRVLQFHYNCLDKFVGLIQIQFVFCLSCDSLEEVVHPELWDKFYTCKTECFSWNKWNKHEPGLFKSEFKGTCAIALCRKFYFGKNEKGEKVNCP